MNRRTFVGTLGLGLLCAPAGSTGRIFPPSENTDKTFSSFDNEMEQFMSERKIPGGALAIVKNWRLVYARGYGWANRDKEQPAKAESLFRIASISKPITAVAIFKLIEQGKIHLEDRAFEIITLNPLLAGDEKPDARLQQITINHLLHHTGGWDRDKSYDPMFRCKIIAQAASIPQPPDPATIIRYMLGQPLDFDPGTRYAYSNFGYCVLGRIIEKVTGQSYEAFVKESVLEPSGIKRMRLGASLHSGDGEVRYYQPAEILGESVFASLQKKVPIPYGGFCLESMDSHGGWIASAVDLARFAAALDQTQPSLLLRPDSIRLLYAPSPPPVSRNKEGKLESTYYACGWMIRPIGTEGKANYWHNGALAGTSSLLVRRADGLSWVVLFNQGA
ncbi:MAG: serine hydrolase domain-containing protein, partial [Verrucomicrobiota bacterium]